MSESYIRLGVNLDHVVTLRQARQTSYPDLIEAIRIAESAGADGITMHLREDRRHIQTSDVYDSRKVITTSMNLEMAATDEMLEIALDVQPDFCCLVPERRQELTTEGGLNVAVNQAYLAKVCASLAGAGIQVSLFVEPDIETINRVKEIGAPIVELHTGCYANTDNNLNSEAREKELNKVINAATHASNLGIRVHAGHGLHVHNVRPIAEIEAMRELNIGHWLVARAVSVGLAQAITEMRKAIDGS